MAAVCALPACRLIHPFSFCMQQYFLCSGLQGILASSAWIAAVLGRFPITCRLFLLCSPVSASTVEDSSGYGLFVAAGKLQTNTFSNAVPARLCLGRGAAQLVFCGLEGCCGWEE